MARKAPRPQPSRTEHLRPWFSHCAACGQRLWADYRNRRTVATLTGLVGLHVLAALYHAVVRKDRALARMLPAGW